jgi:hypothetical protein
MVVTFGGGCVGTTAAKDSRQGTNESSWLVLGCVETCSRRHVFPSFLLKGKGKGKKKEKKERDPSRDDSFRCSLFNGKSVVQSGGGIDHLYHMGIIWKRTRRVGLINVIYSSVGHLIAPLHSPQNCPIYFNGKVVKKRILAFGKFSPLGRGS